MDEEKKQAGRPQIYTGEKQPIRRAPGDAGARSVSGPSSAQRQTAAKKIQQHPSSGDRGEAKRIQAKKIQQHPSSGGQGEAERLQTKEAQQHPVQQSQRESRQRPAQQSQRGRQQHPVQQSQRESQQHPAQQSQRGSQQGQTGRLHRTEEHVQQRDNEKKIQILTGVLGVLIVLLIAAFVYEIVLGNGTKKTGKERMAENGQIEIFGETDSQKKKETEAEKTQEKDQDTTPSASPSAAAASGDPLERAQLLAAQYDYDGAVKLLKETKGYEENAQYQEAVGKFEEQKAACVPYPASEVTHIFFHTLIHDAAKAFDGDEYEAGYNQFMVTEYEFKSIIQQMYDRGYVMVFLDELAPGTDDGNGNRTFATQDILLPPGKIPFVLSQDDVSYYHYMDGDGYASRLIVDENGDVKNEYIEDDGTVSVGDYDMVPIIDTFVKEHPDFSYHGQKGYIALTGYEGILGYRTDEVYKTKEEGRVTVQQQMFFDSYPGGFDEAAFEKECEGARKVAEAMKANGWRFASHTWGHQNMSETDGISFDSFVRDTDRWETWVEPLIGETDTLIYAFGGDIRGMEKYSGERFEYLKKCGFDYFCGVDSAKYWLQVEPDYVRQSRRNVDGYRMYYNPEMLEDLFDVQKAWDPLRPSSVPPI
ncbi:MAG: polysaccharide deacetylase [Lachnospiraceae bacterium]